MPERGPTMAYLGALQRAAILQGDEPATRSVGSVLASGNYVRDPNSELDPLTEARIAEYAARTAAFNARQANSLKPSGKNTVLGRGTVLVGPDGQEIARGLPVPAPAGRGGGNSGAGSGQIGERMLRQSADAFNHAVDEMERLERENPENANIPELAATIEGAGTIPVVGGAIRGALAPTSQRILTPGQQQYRAALALAVDHYIGTLKIRSSVTTLADLRKNLAPQSGQNSAETREQLARTRAYLRQRVRQTAYGDDAPVPASDAAPNNAVQNYLNRVRAERP